DPLPIDGPGGPNVVASAERIAVSLTRAETTALVGAAAKAHRAGIDEVLLAALARACARWTGRSQLRVAVESHGRETFDAPLDLSRTFGWFTAVYPVVLDADAAGGMTETIRAVKQQVRAVPDRGVPYGVARYLGDDADRAALGAQPDPEIA